MPFPAIGAGAAILGGNLLSQGLNIGAQNRLNRKTREWNEKMYWLQRQHNLSDWTMQNEYNSPEAQMKRFQAAGLNPNLIYGQTNEAPSVRSSDVKGWNPSAPQVDLGGAAISGMSAYYDAQVKEANIDNLKVQNTVLQQEALLKSAQIIGTLASAGQSGATTRATEFDTELKSELKQISLQSAQAVLDKTKADTQMTLDENERRAAMQAPTIMKAIEDILTIRLGRTKTRAEINQINQVIENLKKDGRLKDLDINLKRLGIQPGDSMWSRIVGQAINNLKLPQLPPKISEDLRNTESGRFGWELWKNRNK